MLSVDEVFRQMQTEQNEVSVLSDEETIDSNDYCMLESDTTRKILIPEKYSIFGVESDEKVKTVKFAFPRYVDDGRLDLMDYQIRINYKTANPDEENNKDQTQAQNVHTVGDYIVFEWLLSRSVTQYKGTITFIVCAITANDDGTITTEWNTTLATSQSIEGLEISPNENEEERARDLLTELLVSLNNSKNDAITEITQTKTQSISDVEAEGQTQISAVDAKGAQVLESIPDDYTTLENRVDEIEQNRAYVIVGNGSGEFVTLNDSSELKTRNIKLFGKSVQAETTGAQLFNVNVCKNEADLQYKITIDDYATGKITVSMGNPEGAVAMPVNRLSDYCPTMTAGNTYYLSGKHDGSSNGDISLVDVSDTWDFGTSREITEQDLQSAVKFGFGTYSNIMIVEGTTEKPYEVYTGGEPATEPTPEFPLPITSAGNYNAESEKYEVGIGVTNGNLFNIEMYLKKFGVDFEKNGNTYTFNLILSMYACPMEIFKENTLAKISVESLKNITSVNVRLSALGPRGVGNVIETIYATDSYSIIECEFSKFQFDWTSPGKCSVDSLMITKKGTNIKYENPQFNILQIPNPFRGIPVDSGGNYTDAEGQQWICDYIDRDRGKYVQCVQEIVLDGSEDEEWNLFEDYNGFGGSLANGGKAKPNRLICNIAPYSSIPVSELDEFAITTNQLYGHYLYLVNIIDLINVSTVDNFRIWLSKNPVKVIYILNTPIETDLTPDQISALNLFTYQGITNIGTDTMPQVGVEVEYIADTKTYIDNAISQAIAVLNQNE